MFFHNGTLIITPKTKNTTYQYTGGATAYTLTVTPNAITGYNEQYKRILLKKKNDLVITHLFTSTSGKLKKVTTTIKGYFSDTTANYTVKVAGYAAQDGPSYATVKPNTTEGKSGLFGTEIISNYPSYILASTAKNAPQFVLNGSYSTTVYDTKGNDNYKSARTGSDYIYEMAGDDVYSSIGGGTLYAYDYAGNDTYQVNESKLRVYDYSGNDIYNSNDENLEVHDYKGNDTYKLTALDIIDDKAGKDKYTIIAEGYRYYNNDNPNFCIADAKGNDTYNIITLRYDDFPNIVSAITDNAGNDNYILSSMVNNDLLDEMFDNDKNIVVHDGGNGNDSYTVNMDLNKGNVEIFDFGGKKDSLTLSNIGKEDINNLVFMTNISTGGKCDNQGVLYVYNVVNESIISINNFYDVSSGAITGFSSGRIETIKAGNVTMKNTQSQSLYADFNGLRQDVASWLQDCDYGSVEEVLTSGTSSTKEGIATLFAHQNI